MPVIKISFKNAAILLLSQFCFISSCFAIGQEQYVESTFSEGGFRLADEQNIAALYVDSNDWPGVIRAVNDLQMDIKRVTGQTADIANNQAGIAKNTVIIGTIGKSPVIDRLIREGKIDVNQIAGKWESFFVEVVPKPLPGVDNALVIAGAHYTTTIITMPIRRLCLTGCKSLV